MCDLRYVLLYQACSSHNYNTRCEDNMNSCFCGQCLLSSPVGTAMVSQSPSSSGKSPTGPSPSLLLSDCAALPVSTHCPSHHGRLNPLPLLQTQPSLAFLLSDLGKPLSCLDCRWENKAMRNTSDFDILNMQASRPR